MVDLLDPQDRYKKGTKEAEKALDPTLTVLHGFSIFPSNEYEATYKLSLKSSQMKDQMVMIL